MTELLYQTDSYLREFSATVAAVDTDQYRLALDRTAFYPGGGGQPHDLGSIEGAAGGGWSVVKVQKEGDIIWHWLEASSRGFVPRPNPRGSARGGEGLPAAGEVVRGRLNWERRYALMRTHTALHILCGVVWRDYGAQVTGGNMDPPRDSTDGRGQGRMDFEFASLQKNLVGEIEAKCNAEIAAARSVHVRILPRDEAFQIPDLIRTKINLLPPGIPHVRTVEIAGLDLQADGGTHVANTREVGRIQVTDYKSKGAINKRIYIEIVD